MKLRKDDHIHDCTGPGMKCPCGFVLVIPPISFSCDVFNKREKVVSAGFNCDSLDVVADELRAIARRLDRLR